MASRSGSTCRGQPGCSQTASLGEHPGCCLQLQGRGTDLNFCPILAKPSIRARSDSAPHYVSLLFGLSVSDELRRRYSQI